MATESRTSFSVQFATVIKNVWRRVCTGVNYLLNIVISILVATAQTITGARVNMPSQQSSTELLDDTYWSRYETFDETSRQLLESFEGEDRTINSILNSCLTLAESLLSTPFQHKTGSSVFSTEFINLLRNVGNKYDINRKKKHVGVISGSSTSIAGGVLTIVGVALIPVTFGGSIVLMVAGGATTAVGTGVNFGFTAEKAIKDKKRKKNISPELEGDEVQKYIKFENDTATAVALLATALNMIESIRMCSEMRSDNVLCTVKANNIEDVKILIERAQKENNVSRSLELILEYTDSLIQRLHTLIDAAISQGVNSPEINLYDSRLDHFENIKKEPLIFLRQSLEALCDYLQEDNIYPTFSDYLKRKFQINEGVTVASLGNHKKTSRTSTIRRYAFGMKAVVLLGRVLSPVIKHGDDVAKFGARVANVAKVTSVAVGIVASAAGIAIDAAFIGHEAYKLAKGKKEKFPQQLVDLAQSMDEINQLVELEDTTAYINEDL